MGNTPRKRLFFVAQKCGNTWFLKPLTVVIIMMGLSHGSFATDWGYLEDCLWQQMSIMSTQIGLYLTFDYWTRVIRVMFIKCLSSSPINDLTKAKTEGLLIHTGFISLLSKLKRSTWNFPQAPNFKYLTEAWKVGRRIVHEGQSSSRSVRATYKGVILLHSQGSSPLKVIQSSIFVLRTSVVNYTCSRILRSQVPSNIFKLSLGLIHF